ncbi:30S ribosomal protein S9, partial [Streptomyces anthocyanicus]
MAETTVEQPVEETEAVDIESYTTESEAPVVEGEYTSESLAGRVGAPPPAAGQ